MNKLILSFVMSFFLTHVLGAHNEERKGVEANMEGLQLTIESKTVQPNEDFCVSVSVQGFDNLIGMQFSIKYDPSALDFMSVGNFNLSGLSAGVFGTPGDSGTDPGVITLAWVEPALNPVTLDNGTVIFDLCFKAKNASTSDIDFSNTPTAIEITNGDEQSVMFTGVKSELVVGDGGDGGDPMTDEFTLTLQDQTVNPGEDICIPVSVQNFENIIGMQFSINYDPNLLEFKSVGNFNLSGLTEGVFGTPGSDGTTPGNISLAWVEPAINPVTLDNGTVIFELCFTSKVSSGTTDVVFSGNPTSIEITDGDEQNVPFNGENATVVIGDGEGSGFRLALEDVSVKSGNEVCIPVTVRDFINIIGMQLSINYDPNELQFQSVGNFNLSGLTEGAFGTPGSDGTAPGDITLAWVEPAINPVTLDNGTVIFELCFTALGDNGTTTDVVFSDNPTTIEITDGDEQNVPFMGKNGTVTIDDSVVGEDALTLNIQDDTVATSTQFCVDVTGIQATDLVGIQLTIEYDPSQLQFDEVNNFGLTGLNEGQFATPASGKISLAWTDPAVTGVTVEDGTTLFSLCFTALGSTDSTKITFSGDPTAIEVTKKDGDSEKLVDFVGDEGTISFLAVPPPSITSPSIVDATCGANNNPGGSIDITIENGSGNYTFAWDYQDAATEDLMNIPAGTYNVTVTDTESGLTATQMFTVNGPTNPIVIDNLDQTNVNCFGEATGAISVAASGGQGELTYSWNQDLPDGPNQTGLSAGSGYSVTITDTSGCSLESEVIILDEPSELTVDATSTEVQCEGDTDGSISLSVSGGTPDYSINWPGELADDQLEQTGLTNGNYSITVVDDNGCQMVANVDVGVVSPLNLNNVQTTDIGQSNRGSIVINVTGGSSNLTYNWSGPGGFSADTDDIVNLSMTGEYCLTVTDNDGGCSIQRCFNIYNVLAFDNTEVQNTCAESATGTITIDIRGGAAPYAYEWSTGDTTKNLTGLSAGNYGLTVFDSRGVSVEQSFEVGSFNALTLTGNKINVTGNPDNTNGTINLVVSGGRPGYTVQWDNGRTGQVLDNIGVGEYCATVTDENGCQVEECFEIIYVPTPLTINPEFEHISCNGRQDGSLTLVITGGLSPYFITYSDGMTTTNDNGLALRNGLAEGELGYVVEDSNGDTVEGSVNIEEPDPLVITDFSVTHDTDDPGCTGSINISVEGGTPQYMVQWNSPNTGQNIINLCAGEFTPTVVDDRGCMATLEEPIVVNMFSVQANVTNADCQDSANGEIDLEVEGGESPYTYVWKNAQGQTISQEQDPSNLAPGMYTVSVTEMSGNMVVRQVEIFASSSLDVEVDIQTNFNGFAVSCPNASDGSVTATAVNGSGDYSYEWVKDNQMISMSRTLNNAVPGIYEVTAIDGNGCSITKQITLTSPPRVNLNASTRDVSCNGARDGEVVIIASGGGGSVTYNWSNGAQGSRVSFLAKGEYSVTVTDANNCSVSETYTIDEPAPLKVQVETQPANDGCNGSATATVMGGTGPFNYQWNAGLGNGATQTNLCPGDYMVVVTDANGCSNQNAPAALSIKDRRFPCTEASVVITPDGDGLNENFVINCIEDLARNNIKIFNRWGQLVFEADNYDNTWDGRTADGEELPEGPYYYILEYDSQNGRQQTKGSISVLRE